MELWRLLAHNHWFTMNIFGYSVRLCARCSGYLIGFTAPILLFSHLRGPLGLAAIEFQWYIIIALAAPLILDWVTQSWGLRSSNNYVRLITGILMGLDVFLFSKLSTSLQIGKTFFVAVVLAVAVIGVLGKAHRTRLFQGIK